jgi:hypothetical protein
MHNMLSNVLSHRVIVITMKCLSCQRVQHKLIIGFCDIISISPVAWTPPLTNCIVLDELLNLYSFCVLIYTIRVLVMMNSVLFCQFTCYY